jgi:hypothetical protein
MYPASRSERFVLRAIMDMSARGVSGEAPGRGRGAETSVVKKVYFDHAGLCEALLSWHSSAVAAAHTKLANLLRTG